MPCLHAVPSLTLRRPAGSTPSRNTAETATGYATANYATAYRSCARTATAHRARDSRSRPSAALRPSTAHRPPTTAHTAGAHTHRPRSSWSSLLCLRPGRCAAQTALWPTLASESSCRTAEHGASLSSRSCKSLSQSAEDHATTAAEGQHAKHPSTTARPCRHRPPHPARPGASGSPTSHLAARPPTQGGGVRTGLATPPDPPQSKFLSLSV
jgi:hypothetical protein